MKKGPPPTCSVPGCTSPADVRVFLEDDNGRSSRFRESDSSCPYLCEAHAIQNEKESTGLDPSRRYPFSKHGNNGWKTTGWTTYRDVHTGRIVRYADENGFPLD